MTLWTYRVEKENPVAENKTQENDQSVEDFLNTVDDERKRQDCFQILTLMQEVTGRLRNRVFTPP